jgi:hypothetical protein
MFATALGQQPCLTYEESGGKTTYRPRDFDGLIKAVRIEQPVEAARVMAGGFHLEVETADAAGDAEVKLKRVTYDAEPALGREPE